MKWMRLAQALLLALTFSGLNLAEAETCFSDGEASAGMNKICYYKCLSGRASKTIGAVSLCPLSIEHGGTRGQAGLGTSNPSSSFGGNQTCFKKGEYIDGMNKICRYDCLGSPAETTIRATELCPLSVKR
jgi:hypothetical protein